MGLFLSHPRVVVHVNGKPYAYATHFRFESATPHEDIREIDNVDPVELAVTVTNVRGSLGLLRVAGDGGLQGQGVTSHYGQLPVNKYFSVALVDRITQTIFFEARQCVVESESWDMAPKALVSGTLNFKGIHWNNEAR